jgi:hypothetical protein
MRQPTQPGCVGNIVQLLYNTKLSSCPVLIGLFDMHSHLHCKVILLGQRSLFDSWIRPDIFLNGSRPSDTERIDILDPQMC